MTPSGARWEIRLDRTLVALEWLTLLLAVFFGFLSLGPSPDAFAAAAAGGIFVLASAALPLALKRRVLIRELLAVIGTLLVAAAIAFTGGTQSLYLLLSLTPVMFAATFGGLRIGLATALLAAGLLLAIVLGEDEVPLNDLALWTTLYVAVAVAFSQARRILVEEGERAEAAVALSATTLQRLERLERSYDLLSNLAQTTDAAELNPMTVGTAALEGISETVTFEAAIAALSSDSGPVVVARRGEQNTEDLDRTMIPLAVQSQDVGLIVLFTRQGISPEARALVEESLRPVSLAFANILLLQEIARKAVREERARLARELHDEIGPSLASLGLALDLALIQHPAEPALESQLKDLRSSVSTLVEDVRGTVSDLRIPAVDSVTVTVNNIAATLPDDAPKVIVQIDEQRPPRPSLAPDLNAIVTEALRNAVRHSEATEITVHGEVDFDEGSVTVHDNGGGFNRKAVPDGHFGLTGMEERAEKVGAALNITSSSSGTAVSVSWGR